MRRTVSAGLASIAELKASQIGAWRNERLSDGVALAENPILIDELVRALAQPDSESATRTMLAFRALAKNLQLL